MLRNTLLNCYTFFFCIFWSCVLSGCAVAAVNCTISSTNIAFGNVDVTTGASVPSSAMLTLTCSGAPTGNNFNVCVDINGGSASDATSRLMNGSGASQVRFQLYSDSGDASPWGSWSAGIYGGGVTWAPFASGPNTNVTTTVYGLVLANQNSIPGNYSSTLSVSAAYDKDTKTTCPSSGVGSTSTTFVASATVIPACSVSVATLNFGTSSNLASAVNATTAITTKCTNGTPYSIGLDNGLNSSSNQRRMRSSGNYINYGLYLDAGYSQAWLTTASGSSCTSGANTCSLHTGTGANQAITVYGQVPPQANPASGTYTDTVVITLTY